MKFRIGFQGNDSLGRGIGDSVPKVLSLADYILGLAILPFQDVFAHNLRSGKQRFMRRKCNVRGYHSVLAVQQRMLRRNGKIGRAHV